MHIRQLLKQRRLSVRQLAAQSGVRRQSISHFLKGGNLHLDNLYKLLRALGYRLTLTPQLPKDHQQIQKRLWKRIHCKQAALEAFCQQHSISYMSFYGSILRDDFGPESDIDVLIELSEAITMFDFVELEQQLQAVLETKHPVHMVTVKSLSPLVADQILNNQEKVYDEAA